MTPEHAFAIELWRDDGTPLGRVASEIDWEPAEEWAWFECLRQEGDDGDAWTAEFEPRWHPTTGAPYVDGFDIWMRHPERAPMRCTFPREYFRKAAADAADRLASEGRLERGDRYRFVPVTVDRSQSRLTDGPTVSASRRSLPVHNGRGHELLAGAFGVGTIQRNDMPVIVDASILGEVRERSMAAGEVETGGFLAGHLHRDDGTRGIYARVTVQFPAEHTVAEPTRLSFTPRTWTRARELLTLRGENEIFLGWWHAHQAWHVCGNCAPERQAVCLMRGDFFSEHDHLLHRVAFSGAHNVAIVANVVSEGGRREVTFSTFGWRHGLIALRGIHVRGSRDSVSGAAGSTHKEAPCLEN